MLTVRDLLRVKGTDVWSVTPQTTVIDTLHYLAEKDIGALVVLDDGKLVGIISERDIVRDIAKTGQFSLDAIVGSHMTQEVFTVQPKHTIEECMQLMTQKHIRHLPVMENDKLVGLLSIGDVIKAIISTQESMINSLENYIEGRGYGQ
jgi:CBS domain-containing protein